MGASARVAVPRPREARANIAMAHGQLYGELALVSRLLLRLYRCAVQHCGVDGRTFDGRRVGC